MHPPLSVAVIGAGLMGHGIAQVLAQAGHAVGLTDTDPAVLGTARGRIARNLEELGVPAAPVLERVRTVATLAPAVAAADVVIEAVAEVVDVKQALFAEVASLAPRARDPHQQHVGHPDHAARRAPRR